MSLFLQYSIYLIQVSGLVENITKTTDALPRKPCICPNTQNMAPGHQDKHPSSTTRTDTCLIWPVQAPCTLMGKCSKRQEQLAPFPNRLAQGGARPVRIPPWDFYNWTRDRKSLFGGQKLAKCEIQEPLVPCPVEETRALWARIKAKWTEKSPEHPSTWFQLLLNPTLFLFSWFGY